MGIVCSIMLSTLEVCILAWANDNLVKAAWRAQVPTHRGHYWDTNSARHGQLDRTLLRTFHILLTKLLS